MLLTTKLRRSSVAIMAALTLTGLALTGCTSVANHNTHSAKVKPAASVKNTVPTLSPETQQFLTVSPADLLPKEDRCTNNEFIKNSIVGVITGNPAYQQWSDAPSIPFKSSDPTGMLNEVRTEHCGNPTLLDMTIKAMKTITLGGWNVADHNAWMDKFLDEADKDGLRTAFLRKTKGSDEIFVTPEFQQYAALTNALLSRFENVGVVTQTSLTNWYLPGGGLVAGELARTELRVEQESLPLLKLEITEKGLGCVWAGGYNVQDKRFETVACQVPPPPAPPTPSTPPAPPRTPPTPPSTGCTSCGGHTPPCASCGSTGKDWPLNVHRPASVTPQPNDAYKPPPAPATKPAPVVPGGTTQTSTSQSAGTTSSAGNPPAPAPGTGTTSSGATGSVSPGAGSGTDSNNTDPGMPAGF